MSEQCPCSAELDRIHAMIKKAIDREDFRDVYLTAIVDYLELLGVGRPRERGPQLEVGFMDVVASLIDKKDQN